MSDAPGTSITELEFEFRNGSFPLVDVSARADCEIRTLESVHRSDDALLEFYAVRGSSPDRVARVLSSIQAVGRVEYLGVLPGIGMLFEVLASRPSIETMLADENAIRRTTAGDHGVGRVTADVPHHADVEAVIGAVFDRFEDAELTAKRTVDHRAPAIVRNPTSALLDDLTERQEEALRAAGEHGYFDVPRASSAEECAAALGISQPTFSQHLRRGQAKLVSALFETVPPDDR